jgi:hypothetical protein
MSYAAVTALIFAFVAIMHGWRIYIIPKPPAPREVGATCSSAKKNRGCTRNLKSTAPIPRPSKRGRGRYFYIDRYLSVDANLDAGAISSRVWWSGHMLGFRRRPHGTKNVSRL